MHEALLIPAKVLDKSDKTSADALAIAQHVWGLLWPAEGRVVDVLKAVRIVGYVAAHPAEDGTQLL